MLEKLKKILEMLASKDKTNYKELYTSEKARADSLQQQLMDAEVLVDQIVAQVQLWL